MEVKLALISAALAALVTAVIMPYTDPEVNQECMTSLGRLLENALDDHAPVQLVTCRGYCCIDKQKLIAKPCRSQPLDPLPHVSPPFLPPACSSCPLQNLAKLSQHPVAGLVLNTTADAFYAFGTWVGGGDGDDPAAGGPSLRDYYPLTLPPRDPVSGSARQRQQQQRRRRRRVVEPELDWADPRVWEAQTLQARVAAAGAGAGEGESPYYSATDIDTLLGWCGDLATKAAATESTTEPTTESAAVSGSAAALGSESAAGAGAGAAGAAGGAAGGGGAGAGTDAAAAVHFRALVRWLAAAGGDASKVAPGVDGSGVRGLHVSGGLGGGGWGAGGGGGGGGGGQGVEGSRCLDLLMPAVLLAFGVPSFL